MYKRRLSGLGNKYKPYTVEDLGGIAVHAANDRRRNEKLVELNNERLCSN